MQNTQHDLTESTLRVLFIGVLIITSVWILQPFVAAVIWATMVVVATWPILLRLQAMLWNSRALAVTVMTLILLLLFVMPMLLAIGTIVQNSDQIIEWTKWIVHFQIPAPPDWVARLPFIGNKAVMMWQQAANSGINELLAKLMPHAVTMTKWVIAQFGDMSLLFIQFLLTVIIAAVMYAGGETAAAAVKRFGHRLGGSCGEGTLHTGPRRCLAGSDRRGVVRLSRTRS